MTYEEGFEKGKVDYNENLVHLPFMLVCYKEATGKETRCLQFLKFAGLWAVCRLLANTLLCSN